jgi:hypothetical protein
MMSIDSSCLYIYIYHMKANIYLHMGVGPGITIIKRF